MPISRADLQFEYSWEPLKPDDPRVTGQPDSAELNRHEGYEVLHFINHRLDQLNRASEFPTLVGLYDASTGRQIERAIHHGLPSDVRGYQHVMDWLKLHGSKY